MRRITISWFNLFRNLKKVAQHADGEHDTVGAVVVDADGNVAAATSTGGVTAKMIGRVGDSPLLGRYPSLKTPNVCNISNSYFTRKKYTFCFLELNVHMYTSNK